MSIITVTSRIEPAKFVKINRELTVEDLDIRLNNVNTDAEYAHGETKRNLIGSISNDVMLELLETLETETYGSGKFTSNREPLLRLMEHGGATPKAQKEVVLVASVSCSMRGVKKENRQARFDAALVTLEENTNKNLESAKTQMVRLFNETLVEVVNDINANFAELIKNLVVEQNVSQGWFEESLSVEQKAEIQDNKTQIDDIDAQIKALTEKKRELEKNVYNVKRQCVTDALNSTLCDDAKPLVAALQDAEKPQTHTFMMRMS